MVAAVARIDDPTVIDATDPAEYSGRGRGRLIRRGLPFGGGVVVLAVNVPLHGLD